MTPELVLIGSVIIDPPLLDKAIEAGVTASSFANSARGELWRALINLRASGRGLDLVALSMEMGDKCPFDLYMEAERAAPTAMNFQPALDAVLWDHEHRQYIKAGVALSGTETKEQVLDVLGKITALSGRRGGKGEANVAEAVNEAEEAFQNALDGKPDTRRTYPWPLPDMDRILGPIRDCDLMMIAARTSVGKSSMATQLATANVRKGYKVALILTEATAKDTILQIASQVAEVDMLNLNQEFPEKLRKAQETVRRVKECKQLRIFDQSTDADVIASIVHQVKEWADIIIVDHLAQLQAAGTSRYESLTKICKAFVGLKKVFTGPIIVCNQLKRLEKNTTPGLNDLKDTGASEEDFSRVVLIHYPDDGFNGQRQAGTDIEPPETRDYYLIQSKHRYGKRDISMRVRYRAKHTLFLPA